MSSKVVLITGGGRGAGRAVAEAFAEQGWHVALNDLSPIAMDEVIARIMEKGGTARAHVADISSKLALQTILNDIEDQWGRIDVLINNLRVIPNKPILDMDEWDWRRTLDVNLTGAFLMTQVVGRIMRAQGGGTIIHLLEPDESDGHGAFTATQQGLKGLIEIAQKEMSKVGVHVHTMNLRDVSDDQLLQKVFEILGLP